MKKIIPSIFYLLCSLFVFSTPALAKVIIQEQGMVVIADTEVIDDDLFVGAESVSIEGTVTGDVFVGAGSVRVSGDIRGGLFVGTGDLILTGATVGNSIVVGAGNVTIDAASKIGGSLIAGSGNLKNSAPIGRNLMIGAGTIYQDGKVGKEARLGGSSIILGGNTKIVGNLSYALAEEGDHLSQDPGATIAGTVSRYTPPVDENALAKAQDDFARFGLFARNGWLIISFLGSILIGYLLLKLFPKTFLGLSNTVSKSLMSSLGSGLLIVVAAVPIFLVLALTVIGLPLVGLLIPLFCIELHLAKLVSAYALGRFVAKQFNWNNMGIYGLFSVGLIIFYCLRAIPGVGGIVSILFTWTGLGAIWLYTRANLKNL